MTDNTVKFGDAFYLKHETGQYLVAVDRGRYNWPQLGNTGKVALQLLSVDKNVKTGEVKSGSPIKIRTTESVTQNNDILGAFSDSHDCYYWRDGYDNNKQSWLITKVSDEPGPIRYGDRVYLTNCSYTTQKLTVDTRNQGYITTTENAKDWWTLESTVTASVQPSTPNPADVFKWSVASGDPSETSVILWTRVEPEVYKKNPSLSLKYEVATDKEFKNLVVKGEVPDSNFNEETDYTVRVDVDKLPNKLKTDSKLKPYKRNGQNVEGIYFYRFIYEVDGKDVPSPVGRCQTLPAANDETFNHLKLAVLTCNDYSSGYFNALYTLEESEIDFVIHLGDFAYEYFEYPPGYGDIIRTGSSDEKDPLESSEVATSLASFRRIHRTYREDPALQWAMANYTWIIILDDHEIADNCYWDYDHKTMGVNDEGSANPFYKEKEPEVMRKLFEGATQAWREYVPARVEKVSDDPCYKLYSNYPSYKLYRDFCFGKLVDFFLTDSRSFRDKPELEKNAEILEAVTDAKAKEPNAVVSVLIENARSAANADKKPEDWKWSMLGPCQKKWLIDGVTKSDAKWKVWGNQTLLATSPVIQMQTHDDWHGFKAERYEILQTIKEHETNKPGGSNEASHFVVFTGDMHTSLIAYLKTEFPVDEVKTSALEGGKNIVGGLLDPVGSLKAGAEGVKNIAGGLLHPISTGEKVLETGAEAAKNVAGSVLHPIDTAISVGNEVNLDYSKLVGVEFMTPSLTSPGISEGIYATVKSSVEKAGGKIEDYTPIPEGGFKSVAKTLAPVTETASAAASYVLGTASSILGTASDLVSNVVPDVIENPVKSVVDEASLHKLFTGNLIKALSPHIKHFDSGINGYAIAEFTPDKLTWHVYEVNTTEYDKLPDGRNVSTNRVKRKLVQSATYNPNKIMLND